MPAKLSVLKTEDSPKELSYIEVTIHEGKFHQVKRMFRAVNKKVIYLQRITFGTLVLPKDLAPGSYRELTNTELESLKNCC